MKETQEERIQLVSAYVKKIQVEGFGVFQTVHGLERLELLNWSDAVVQAYGTVYKQHKGLIDDIDLLPVSKDDIRVALKIQFFGFAVKKDEEAMRTISNAYVNLCRFQPIAVQDAQKLEELNVSAVPQVNPFEDRDPGQITEQEQHYMECFQTFQQYLAVVEIEKEALREEFTGFVKELFGA